MIPYGMHQVTPEDKMAVLAALNSGQLAQGPLVEQFERALTTQCGAHFAVACSSGTAALWMAYSLLGPEGRPLPMPAISFVATANAAMLAGHRPIFQDVDPVTGLALLDHPVGVTLGGQPTGHRHLVLDACHGPLSLPAGTDMLCLSFHPVKHVACGEGGALVTNSPVLAEAARALRDHGRIEGKCERASFNWRLDEMSAALGLSQLQRYADGVTRRRVLAARYDTAFAGRVHTVPHGPESVRHLYSLLLEDRDTVQERLRRKGIGTAIHYKAMHLEPFYQQRMGYRAGEFPNAERFARQTLSIPLYPTLTESEQDRVITAVLEAVE